MSQANRRVREEKKKEERDDDNHTRSSNPPPCAYQDTHNVLRDRFNSPALIPAVNYKLCPILCQLTFVPYTLHLWVLTCDQKYITMCWSQTSGSDARVILTPWRGGSQDSNQAPGQDNGLNRRWMSVQKSEEEQDGQAERDKKKIKMKKRSQKGLQLGNRLNLTQKQKRVFWPNQGR